MRGLQKYFKTVITLNYILNIQSLYNNFIFPSDTCRYTQEKRNRFGKQSTELYGYFFYKLAALRTNRYKCFNWCKLPQPYFLPGLTAPSA